MSQIFGSASILYAMIYSTTLASAIWSFVHINFNLAQYDLNFSKKRT